MLELIDRSSFYDLLFHQRTWLFVLSIFIQHLSPIELMSHECLGIFMYVLYE